MCATLEVAATIESNPGEVAENSSIEVKRAANIGAFECHESKSVQCFELR